MNFQAYKSKNQDEVIKAHPVWRGMLRVDQIYRTLSTLTILCYAYL